MLAGGWVVPACHQHRHQLGTADFLGSHALPVHVWVTAHHQPGGHPGRTAVFTRWRPGVRECRVLVHQRGPSLGGRGGSPPLLLGGIRPWFRGVRGGTSACDFCRGAA